ncbi:MAG: TonB-dependent receptor [Pseudomonadota bacterium]
MLSLFATVSATTAHAEKGAPTEEVLIIGSRDVIGGYPESITTTNLNEGDVVGPGRTIGDWLETAAGVTLNGQGGLLQSYSIRGFSRGRIRTEVEGVPIITDRRAGNSLSFLPPELIGSTSVERSAASALYGSGAMGGVVGLTLRESENTRFGFSAQTNDESIAAALTTSITPELFGGIALRQANSAEAGDGSVLNTGYEQIAGALSGEKTFEDLQLRYRFLASHGSDIGRSNALFPDVRVSETPHDSHTLAVVELRDNGLWLLRAYHHYQDWSTEVDILNNGLDRTDYQSHTLGGLFQRSTAFLGSNGALGVEWVGRRDVDIREDFFADAQTLTLSQQVVDGDEDTIGIFVDQRWQFDALSVAAGLRTDHIRQTSEQRDETDLQWSGSFRVERPLKNDVSLYGELATAYRFPSLSERYFSGETPRGEILGNPFLDPEERRNGEIGLSVSVESGMTIRASAYYSDLQNYIERFPVTDSLISFRNVEGAWLQGLEFEASFPFAGAQHLLTYQWQEGESDAGATLADLNPSEWRYFVSWPASAGTLRSDLRYRTQRSEFGGGELPLDSAVIWDVSIAHTLTKHWRTEIYLDNALDEEYRATADDLSPLQPGRAFGVRVIWGGES